MRITARDLIAAAGRLAACLAAALLVGNPARALDPARHIAQYHHTAWTYRDGVPPNIHAIAQTPDGFLWLGSDAGLFRFDGVRAEPFGRKQTQDAGVASLATSLDGDLWAGLFTGTLARVRGERVETFKLPAPVQGAAILYLAPARGGVVWVGTHNAVLRFDGRRWRQVAGAWPRGADYADSGGVWGLALGRDGTLWAKNVLATYYLRRGAARFEAAPGYGGGVFNFARAPDGRLWTADFATRRFYALPDLKQGAPPLRQFGAAVPRPALGAVQMDRDGVLWIANRVTFGLYRLGSVTGSAELERFTVSQGLTTDLVEIVFEDREGDVWVGTARGLDRFRAADVATEARVPIRDQGAEIAATADAVYVYTGLPAPVADPSEAGGRLFRLRPGRPPELLSPNIGRVFAMTATPAGDLFLALGGKMVRWRDGTVTTVNLPSEVEGAHVASLAVAGDDLWVSVRGEGGAYRRRAGQWTRVIDPSLPPSTAPFLATGASGALYFIYFPGPLAQVRGDRIMRFTGAAAANVGQSQAFVADPDGPIISGTLGVARLDGQAFQVIPAPQAPALSNAASIVETSADIWFITPTGVARVARRDLLNAFANPTARPRVQTFDAQDGFSGAELMGPFGAVRGPDGRVWFFTPDGLSWIDPRRLYRNQLPPPVIIRSVTANGRSYTAPANLRLTKGTSKLEIDYTATSLAVPERVRFRYRLEGVDKEWVDAGGRRQAFYTNLGPGTYRFQVIAANNDGVWNTTGAALGFRIAPLWWQTWAFKALVALALAAALWVLYRLRLRQVSARLRARLQERLDERERIARELHDTLLQAVQGLTLKLQSFAEQMPAEQPARKLMEQALDRADEVLAEGRDRVRNLRAAQASDVLSDVLAAAADRLRLDPAIEIAVRVDGARRPLHPVVFDEVVAIAKEALFNAFTHSHAEHVAAEVRYERNQLVVRVHDDGVGIEHQVLERGREGHYGLTGMRERTAKIQGQLSIRSSPGMGVEVTIVVPAGLAYSRAGRHWPRFALRSGRVGGLDVATR
jgi:signal transduction histidine kinase/ligand-binding sensor domain-containing protein